MVCKHNKNPSQILWGDWYIRVRDLGIICIDGGGQMLYFPFVSMAAITAFVNSISSKITNDYHWYCLSKESHSQFLVYANRLVVYGVRNIFLV